MMYLKIIYSRKFRRLIISVSLVTIFVAIISVITFFDIDCIPKKYNPKISLKIKTIDIKSGFNSLDPKWTPIVDNIVSIYSAFYYENKTLIIGLLDQKYIKTHFYCEFKDNKLKKIKAKVVVLPESWSEYYTYVSVKIICPQNKSLISEKVKISFKINDQYLDTNYVIVNQIIDKKSDLIEKPIVVCVRPLFGPFTSSAELLEFIAYYRVNGIQRFIFYDLSIGEEVKQLIKDMPFVKLLSYDLPIDSTDIHADGQIAALNDCVLRSSDSVVIHVDIDELIVPSKLYLDIRQFIQYKAFNSSVGALVIPNVMICDEFNPGYRFPRILNATVRQTSKWEHRDRSKTVIMKPMSINRLGIHTVWEWSDNTTLNENVKESDAMLFHYRSCCRVWQPFYENNILGFSLFFLSYKDQVVDDLSVKRFETKIIKFINQFVELSDNH